MDNDPKHTSKFVAKWLKDNKFKVLVWPTNPTPLHQLCQEEWAKIHPTYCGKLVKGYQKRLPQVNTFKLSFSQLLKFNPSKNSRFEVS